MVRPGAVDQQIAARQAFLAKAGAGQKIFGGLVVYQAGGLNTMQPQCLENKGHQRLDGVGHVALPGEFGADPVTQRAALGDAAPYIGQGAATQQRVIALAQNKEDVGGVLPRLFLIALDAAAESAARQLVIGPDRLPGREEFPALAPQARPGEIIADARIAQIDALAADHRLLATRKGQAAHESDRPGLGESSLDHYSAASGTAPALPPKGRAKAVIDSSFLTGPTAAMVGWPASITRAAKALTVATSMASSWATISAADCTRPSANSCPAICSERLEGRSIPISSDTLSWARARATSASVRFSLIAPISPAITAEMPAASASPVPT